MNLTTCPNCKMSVLPNSIGVCPKCQAIIDQESSQNLVKEATSLWRTGQQDRALDLVKQSIKDTETASGSDHPYVAIRLNLLGELYNAKGEKSQAEALYRQALQIDEQALGTNHPDVATILNSLAVLYWSQGKYAQAEPLSKRALEIDENALGSDSPKVATDLKNLAALYYTQRQYTQAEPLFNRALAIREQTLEPDHPEVAEILNNLAALYRATKRYKEAAGYDERAEDIHREDTIRQLGGSPLQCQFSLKGVSFKRLTQEEWGDLFGCEKGLIYSFLSSTGPGLSTIGNRLEAQDKAIRERDQDFGLTIEERIRKRGAELILKSDITSIASIASMTGFKIVHYGGELNLRYEDAARGYQIVQSWWKGTLKVEVDTQGANLGFPPVSQLLPWLVDGSICSQVDQRILEEIPNQTGYLQAIFPLFERLIRQEKEAVLKSLSILPKGWLGAFRSYLKKRKLKFQSYFNWLLAGVFLGAIGTISFLTNLPARDQPMTGMGVLSMLLMFTLPVTIIFAWITSSTLNDQKHLLSLITAPGKRHR